MTAALTACATAGSGGGSAFPLEKKGTTTPILQIMSAAK